jgi:NADPH:quinone reductase-like Zn-dependent oxidoreductase
MGHHATAMKAISRDRYGSPDVLSLREVPIPAVPEDGVLVKVVAASVNRADLDYLYGTPGIVRIAYGLGRPRVHRVGLDVAGTVEAVGPMVTRLRIGDRVFADLFEHGHGAFAEYVAAPERAFAVIPHGVSFEDAACLPEGGILAVLGMGTRNGVQAGDRVLINGASGSVGPFAVQIAKARGAEVTGTARGSKLDFVRAIGADHALDYTREDFTRQGVRYDRIVDVWATHGVGAIRRALTPDGDYVAIGGSLRLVFWASAVGLGMRALGSRQRIGLPTWQPFEPQARAELTRLAETGVIRPVIDRRFPLAEAAGALRYVDDGHAMGKVVITI